MKTSFTSRLFASHLFVLASVVLLTAILLTRQQRRHSMAQLRESLATQADLLYPELKSTFDSSRLSIATDERLRELGRTTKSRLTLIRADGTVLADSERTAEEVKIMDNHGQRPEVLAAAKAGVGSALRHSDTLGKTMLYVARTYPNGIIRMALPLDELDRRADLPKRDLLFAGGLAAALVILVSIWSAWTVNRPLRLLSRYAEAIGEGQSPALPDIDSPDEVGRLSDTVGRMAQRIQEKVTEVEEERSQLAGILGGLNEGVLAVDHDGQVLFINAAAARLFQVEADRVKGRPFLEIIRQSALSEFLRQAVDTQAASSRELSVHLPDEHLLAAKAVPVAYPGSKSGVLIILYDVTELRKLERVRQEFVANVSHELKTPLTAVLWQTETLLNGALEDKKHNREFVQVIQDQASRLGRLIDDILDLSAIEAKRMRFDLAPLALQDLGKPLMASLKPLALAKKVKLINSLEASLPKVLADREKVVQILTNLVDNAIKFNRTGGEVEVSATVAGNELVISVRDTGLGIPPADVPRIFERFFRVDRARSREMGGTGLGLSIVKHLVEAQGGSVSVESQFDKGSTFRFTLPLA